MLNNIATSGMFHTLGESNDTFMFDRSVDTHESFRTFFLDLMCNYKNGDQCAVIWNRGQVPTK